MPIGMYNSGVLPADFAKKSFQGMLTRLMPNGSAPLFVLTSMLRSETAVQVEHGYYSKTMVFPSVQLSGSITATDTLWPVVSSANVVPNMILRADTSGEQVLVENVVSDTLIQVRRSFGNISPGIVASGVNFWMVGTAFEEGSQKPNAMAIIPQRVTNFTQIFRNTWAITDTLRNTMVIAGDTNVAENRQDCAAFHAVDIEKGLFFSQKYQGQRNGQPIRTMDGLISNITQYASGNITTLGSTTNFTQFETAIDPVFNVATDPKGGSERVMFCGGVAKRVINNIGRLNGTYQLVDGQNEFGLQFSTFKLARGKVTLIEHPLFNAFGPTSTFAKMGVVVDMATFNLAYLGDRKTRNKEFNGEDGQDAIGGTLTSELTCLVRNPSANAVLYNFTAAAQG